MNKELLSRRELLGGIGCLGVTSLFGCKGTVLEKPAQEAGQTLQTVGAGLILVNSLPAKELGTVITFVGTLLSESALFDAGDLISNNKINNQDAFENPNNQGFSASTAFKNKYGRLNRKYKTPLVHINPAENKNSDFIIQYYGDNHILILGYDNIPYIINRFWLEWLLNHDNCDFSVGGDTEYVRHEVDNCDAPVMSQRLVRPSGKPVILLQHQKYDSEAQRRLHEKHSRRFPGCDTGIEACVEEKH